MLELLRFSFNSSPFLSVILILLYKRPFRKEKEVVTFLMSLLKWILAISGEAPSLMRGLNANSSLSQ